MKKSLSVMAMVIALTLMCSHINAQEAFTMKYNFKEGKAYKTITKVCTTTTQSMMGQEMKFDVNLDIQSDMNVTKVDPNGNTTMVINVKGNTEMNLPEAAGGKKSEAFTNEAINATFASNGQSVNQTMVDKDGKNVTTVKVILSLQSCLRKQSKQVTHGRIKELTQLQMQRHHWQSLLQPTQNTQLSAKRWLTELNFLRSPTMEQWR